MARDTAKTHYERIKPGFRPGYFFTACPVGWGNIAKYAIIRK